METTFEEAISFSFDIVNAKNIFAFYVGALFLLAYVLAIVVSVLHLRQDPIVYPFTRPQPGAYFTEYIIKVRTSLRADASLDQRGRVILRLLGSFADSIPLQLKKGKGIDFFLERGSTNIFVYHSPYDLGDVKEMRLTMANDAPHETLQVTWCPSYISVMHPESKKYWGCLIEKKLQSYDVTSEKFEFKDGLCETYGILKAVCLFHHWISIFNTPLRFGNFNNFVNTVMVFFGVSTILTIVLFFENCFHIKVLPGTPSELTNSATLRCFFAATIVWLLEILAEAFLRNTCPYVNVTKYGLFQGLVEPVKSSYGLQDFTINFDWDKVRPVIPKRNVEIPFGRRHTNAQCIFPITVPKSFYNLWGFSPPEIQRATNWYLRTINFCALPLPASLRWLSIEATGRKESILTKQFLDDFTSPMCYFCCWIVDWPLHYLEEQQQAGLIISHIICKDVLALVNMRNKAHRARLAQITVHQWHGLICCTFLHIVRDAMTSRLEPTTNIRGFINNTVDRFGKRNAREIQATWRKRQSLLKELQIRKAKIEEDEQAYIMTEASMVSSNENVSAQQHKKKQRSVTRSVFWGVQSALEIPNTSREYSDVLDMELNEEYTEDNLIFEDLSSAKDVKNPLIVRKTARDKRSNLTQTLQPQELPTYRIVQEGNSKAAAKVPASTRKDVYLYPHDTSLIEMEMGGVSSDDVYIDINTNAKTDEHSLATISSKAATSSDALTVRKFIRLGSEMQKDICGNKSKNAQVQNRANTTEQNINTNADDANAAENLENVVAADITGDSAPKISAPEIPIYSAMEKTRMEISLYEETSLGPAFNPLIAPDVDTKNPHWFFRHHDELSGFCCDDARCQANLEIHQKVGHTSLEIIKKILIDLLYFAMDSRIIKDRSKLWLRKKMVLDLFDMMEKKSEFYSDDQFQTNKEMKHRNIHCLNMLTSVFTILQVLVEMTVMNIERATARDLWERKMKYLIEMKPVLRCLFCAQQLKEGKHQLNAGCDNLEKLVTFFKRDTIIVAEREINIELQCKLTLQKYCALIMNLAKREVMLELEDPPCVLTTKVTRAMICYLLDEMLPKHTDFRDMTADELRQVGTRRERIQARHDPTAGANKSESAAVKRKSEIMKQVLENLITKWKITAKENELNYCAMLLAEILVHERMMGFSIYAGFIAKEHEVLLDSSRARLGEVEKKAYETVLKVGRYILRPKLKKILKASRDIDVMFRNTRMEILYIEEAICVIQFQKEPVFLKTCCYYIRDIVYKKVDEFKELMTYLAEMVPAEALKSVPKLKKLTTKYEIDGPIKLQTAEDHTGICSPILRWGPAAIKGVPPLPAELRDALESKHNFEELSGKAVEAGGNNEAMQDVIAKVIKMRRKVKGFLEVQSLDRSRKLQLHLARVQGHLTEQIALVSQSISDQYLLETDYQREYNKDELFRVELFATGKLNTPISKMFGTMMLTLIILTTLIAMFFTTFKASSMNLDNVREWFLSSIYAMLMYLVILEPLKCLLYFALRLYVD